MTIGPSANATPPGAPPPQRRRDRVGCAVFGAILLVSAALLVGWVISLASERGPRIRLPAQVPFEAAAWREGTDAARLSMIEDLRASRVMLGKTREELERLLGPPSVVGFGYLAWHATKEPQVSGGSEIGYPGVSVWIEEGGAAYEMR